MAAFSIPIPIPIPIPIQMCPPPQPPLRSGMRAPVDATAFPPSSPTTRAGLMPPTAATTSSYRGLPSLGWGGRHRSVACRQFAITPLDGTSEWVLPARSATGQHPQIAASRRGLGVRSCSRLTAAASHSHQRAPDQRKPCQVTTYDVVPRSGRPIVRPLIVRS